MVSADLRLDILPRCLSLRFPVDRGGSEAQVAEAVGILV